VAVAAFVLAGSCGAASEKGADPARVIAAFKRAGIPVGEVVIFTAATDPNHLLGRPHLYTAKIAWADKRHPKERTDFGTIEFFSSAADLEARETYVESTEKNDPLLKQYVYVDDLALMRLSFKLTPSQAAEYQVVLAKVEAQIA